jgi:hypothetical protein
MKAEITQEARPSIPMHGGMAAARPAILFIDGVRWSSDLPVNSGDAASINQDAHTIAAFVNCN